MEIVYTDFGFIIFILEYLLMKCPECNSQFYTAASMLEHLALHCQSQIRDGYLFNTAKISMFPPYNGNNEALLLPMTLPMRPENEEPTLDISSLDVPKLFDNSDSPELSDSDSEKMDIDETGYSSSSEVSSPSGYSPILVEDGVQTEVIVEDEIEGSVQPDESSSVCAKLKSLLERDCEIKKKSGADDFDPLSLCVVTMEGTNPLSPPIEIEEPLIKPPLIELIPPVESSALDSEEKLKMIPGRRKHLCFYCRKEFSGSTALKRHILLHTGEKPFKCQWCNSAYTRKFMLEKHYKVWHDEKTEFYVKQNICPYCKREIKSPDQLKTHMTYHVNEGSHRCRLCNMAFRYHAMLREHMTKYHHQNVKEDLNASDPEVMIIEDEKADINEESPTLDTMSDKVKELVTERKYPCNLCSASFRRRAHLAKHLESAVHVPRDGPVVTKPPPVKAPKAEKVTSPYKEVKNGFHCDVCGAEFQYRAQYVFHLLNHEK